MGFAEIADDAKATRERIAGLMNSEIDVKFELTENILPLFEAMCEAAAEQDAEIEGLGEAVDELIDQTEDVLHVETAAEIMKVLELGVLLATELEAVLPRVDDLKKKKIRALIKGYLVGKENVENIITEITVPDDAEPAEPAAPPAEPVQPDVAPTTGNDNTENA